MKSIYKEFDKKGGLKSEKWEAAIINEYFIQTRIVSLKKLFEKELIRENVKLTLDFEDPDSLAQFHRKLRNCFLNYQIISQIYYNAIIKTTYLLYTLQKINPKHEILSIEIEKLKFDQVLNFFKENPEIVKLSWIYRKMPFLGFLKRCVLL